MDNPDNRYIRTKVLGTEQNTTAKHLRIIRTSPFRFSSLNSKIQGKKDYRDLLTERCKDLPHHTQRFAKLSKL